MTARCLQLTDWLDSSLSAAMLRANPLGVPIGCQTYPVRKTISTDPTGRLKQLSDAGFPSVELCSPWGYSQLGSSGHTAG